MVLFLDLIEDFQMYVDADWYGSWHTGEDELDKATRAYYVALRKLLEKVILIMNSINKFKSYELAMYMSNFPKSVTKLI